MKNPFNIPDPEFDQQLKKYKNPIPSRTAILNFLKKRKKLLKLDKLADLIGIEDLDQLEALSRRLNAMVHDGTLIVNRKKGYGVRKKTDLLKGVVQAHRDGYGFFVSPELEEDGYIVRELFDPSAAIAAAFPGQIVDLSPEAFDDLLRPRIDQWLHAARKNGVL